MRIITINLPVSYLKAIDSLTGQKGLYPSRSELIRVAIRDFLIRELEAAKTFQNYHATQIQASTPTSEIDENLFVRVPLETTKDGLVEYKTYRIVKR